MEKSGISRRSFLGRAAAAGAAGVVIPSVITGCSGEPKKKVEVPVMLDQAPDGPPLKAGLIGCGNRGTGAAIQFLSAGPNLQITALGDLFQDRIDLCREQIKKAKGQEIPPENCFTGFDACQKVIDSGVDIILHATPPFFRPEHIAAAVQAGKHIFAEKPACVDPVGARSVMASAKKAEAKGLCFVAGTQRRHQRDYVATWQQVAEGKIGRIVGSNAWWNGGKGWYIRDPDPQWSELEYMIRTWGNWTWFSGDHIVEQHVHNLDVINWFTGSHPVKASGSGSRIRRDFGNQYDNFNIDYTFNDGTHEHSQCRQINGCSNNVSERIQGTLGSTNCKDTIWDLDGNVIWQYEYPLDKNGKPTKQVSVPAGVQEHIDLVTAIRTGKVINEAENLAISSLTAVMGRITAYTGKDVTWEEMMNSDMKLGPKVFVFGPVDLDKTVPLPGEIYVPEIKPRKG